MKRTVLIILPLFFMLVSCGTKTTTEEISSSQRLLFRYLPYNTEFLLYTNLDNLRNSKIGMDNLIPASNDSSHGWIKSFEDKTGIGLNKGIRELIIAGTSDEKNVLIVRFENRYDEVKNYFNSNPGFIKTGSEKNEIFALKDNPSTLIYIPGNSILVLSNDESFIRSLTVSEGKSLNENNDLISVINNIRIKNNIWMVADKGTFAWEIFNRFAGKNSRLLSPEILSSIENLSLSADLSGGKINVESVLSCSTAGDAYLLTSAVQGAVAMNILSQKNEKLGKIFSRMDVKREADLIRFHIDLTPKELNDLKLITKYKNQVNKF